MLFSPQSGVSNPVVELIQRVEADEVLTKVKNPTNSSRSWFVAIVTQKDTILVVSVGVCLNKAYIECRNPNFANLNFLLQNGAHVAPVGHQWSPNGAQGRA